MKTHKLTKALAIATLVACAISPVAILAQKDPIGGGEFAMCQTDAYGRCVSNPANPCTSIESYCKSMPTCHCHNPLDGD